MRFTTPTISIAALCLASALATGPVTAIASTTGAQPAGTSQTTQDHRFTFDSANQQNGSALHTRTPTQDRASSHDGRFTGKAFDIKSNASKHADTPTARHAYAEHTRFSFKHSG